MADDAYVIPDIDLPGQRPDSGYIPNRPLAPREAPDGALRRLVENDAFVIPDTPDPQPRSLIGDVGRGFASSAVGTAGAATGFMEYVFGSGGNLTAAREGLTAKAESIAEGMSPQMKTALGREFTALPSWAGGLSDKSAWEGFGTALGSIAATVVSTSGSLVSAAPAIIAGAMAGPYAVPAATVIAAATGGVLGGGSVWNEVATEFQKLSEDERMRNPIYAKNRETMDAGSAIDATVREVAGQYVQGATAASALVNAATGPFLGKLGAGKLGGVWAGAKMGARTEALEEFADEGSNQYFAELGGAKLTGREFDGGKVIEGAVRGAVGGGGLGGIMGGIGGLRDTTPPTVQPPAVAPEIQAATSESTATAPVAPGAAPPVDPAIVSAISQNPESRAPAAPYMGPTSFEPSLLTGGFSPRSGGVDPTTGQHLLPMEVEGGIAPPAAPVVETPEAPNPNQSFFDFVMQGLKPSEKEAVGGLMERSPEITQQIRAMHESGKSADEIADATQWDADFIRAALERLGVAANAPRPPAAVPPTETPKAKKPRVRKPKASVESTPPESAITPAPAPATPAVAPEGETTLQGEVLPPTADPKKMPPGPERRVAEARQTARDELVVRVRAVVGGADKVRKPKTRSARAESEMDESARDDAFLGDVQDAENRSVERVVLGTNTGMSDEQALTAFVDQLLDEAQKEAGDPKTKSVRELATLLLDRAGALAHDELVQRKVLEDTEQSTVGRSSLQRVEKKHILLAAEGDMEAIQRIQQRIAATRQSDMGRLFRRINGALSDAGLPTDQEWMKPLAEVGATAKAGGSIGTRAARTRAVEGKKEEARAAVAKTAEQLGSKHAEVTAAINGTDPSWIRQKEGESGNAGQRAIGRWKAAYDAMAESLGVNPNTTAMLRAVGFRKEKTRGGSKTTPSDAATLIALYHELSRLEKVSPSMLQNLQAAEAMARAGDPTAARQLIKDAKAEVMASTGTGTSTGADEDVLSFDQPEAIEDGSMPDDAAVSGEGLAALGESRRAAETLALGNRQRGAAAAPALTAPDRAITREVEEDGPEFVAGTDRSDVPVEVRRQQPRARATVAEREALLAALRKKNAESGGGEPGTGRGTLTVKKLEEPGPTITRRGLLRGVGAAVLSWVMGDKVFAQTVPAVERARNGDLKGAMEAIAKHSPNAGYRALAKRLAPLVDGLPLRVIEFGKSYAEDFPASLNRALGVVTLNKQGKVSVYLRHDPSGKRASGLNDETMLHEAIHAALMSRYGELDGRRTLGGGIGGKAMPGDEHIRTLNDLYIAYRDYFVRQPDYKEQRAEKVYLRASVRDLDEFIAYATTSPEFQAWMKKQTLNEVGMWRRFVNAVAGLLGFSRDERTFLDAAMDATNALLEVAATVPPRAVPDAIKQQADSSDEYTTKMMAVPGAVKDFFDGAIPKNVGESGLANALEWMKKVGLGFTTTRQIEYVGDEQFPRTELMDWMDPDSKGNLLHVAVVAQAKRRQLAENRLTAFLSPIRKMTALSRESERKVSLFAIDASMAEAHPDADLDAKGKNKHLVGAGARLTQARKDHAALVGRYAALTADEKAAYHDLVNTAAQAHTTAVESIIHNVVDRWWMDTVADHLRDPDKNALPVADKKDVAGFLKGIKERANSKKLTDDEKLMLGDDWFGLIVKAHARAKMDGPYIPFQRQGDFVVSWREPAEEYVTLDSQEAVDKFAKDTQYKILKVEKRYYDKDGNEILEPDLGIMIDLQGTAKSELGDQADPLELGRAMRKAAREALKKTRERDATREVFEVQQQVQGMALFETVAEAREMARELRESGRSVKELDLRARPADRRSLLQDADFNKLTQAIERDKTMTSEQKNAAIDALQDAMLMVLPNRTLNSTLVKRRKVLGPSTDVRRVMANYGLAVANFTAGVDTGLTITTALAEMARVTNEGNTVTDKDTGTTLSRRRILREIETRLLDAPLENPGTGSRWVRRLQSMAFVHFLASPSYSMIQLTQPWMLTMPILAARFGARSGPAALAKATRDIGFAAVMKAGGKDTVAAMRTLITGQVGEPQPVLDMVRQRLAGQADGAALGRMLDTLSAEGLVDGDAGLELMRAEVTADAKVWRKLGQLESLTRAIPAAIEVINRTSSAVAAYRLAIKAGQSHDQAVLTAREVVDQSQADYSSSNTARYMDTRRYPWLAPMMTFRKYAQAVYALLARQVYLSAKGKSKAERRQAMKTLAYVLGTHAAVAGTLGLPTEAITIVLGITALALGQDEPWDWEREVRQAMAEVFGKEGAEVVTRGLPRLAGIDLSGRMGLNSLIFINDLRDFERQSTIEYAGSLLLGAPGAMVAAWAGAPSQMAKGDYGRALEAIMPKGVRDLIQTFRFEEEGITTKRGERIDSNREFTTGDAIIKGLGFTPAAVAETYERRNAVQGANRRINNERVALLRDWRQAKPGDRNAVWVRILEWNRELPPDGRAARITRANLIASEQEAKRRARASGGADYLPKGREWIRREGDFANTRE
jgi:hypothetical protein